MAEAPTPHTLQRQCVRHGSLNPHALNVFQVCDRRRGAAPDDPAGSRAIASISQAANLPEPSHVVWCNVVATDKAQAIRIAGDTLILQRPACVVFQPGQSVGPLTVEEILALHADDAPCIVGPHTEPELPDGTLVCATIRAKDLGLALRVLELDPDVAVLAWNQNAPGLSPEVELDLLTPFLPDLWHGSDVTLSWRWLSDGAMVDYALQPHCIRGKVKTAPRSYTRHLLARATVEEFLK